MTSHLLPLHVGPAPDPLDRELEPLLGEPFASAWAAAPSCKRQSDALRGRLLERILGFARRVERDVHSEATAAGHGRTGSGCAGEHALHSSPRPRAAARRAFARAGHRAQAGAKWSGPATDSPRMAGAPRFGRAGRMHPVAARLSRCAGRHRGAARAQRRRRSALPARVGACRRDQQKRRSPFGTRTPAGPNSRRASSGACSGSTTARLRCSTTPGPVRRSRSTPTATTRNA